ncbi:hypothetical protein MD484_g8071, partial [Candolleomyces efflorescens]
MSGPRPEGRRNIRVHDADHKRFPRIHIPLDSLKDTDAVRPAWIEAPCKPDNPNLTKYPAHTTHHKSQLQVALRVAVAVVLGLVNVVNIWIAASDLIHRGCSSDMSGSSSLVAQLCQTDIVKSFPNPRSGLFSPQSLPSNQWAGNIDVQLRRINNVLGLNFDLDRDVSLRGAGAAILPEFTTQTATTGQGQFAGQGTDGVRLPIVVIEELLVLGDCWEFAGHRGTVGIRLSEPVNITSLSVHYISPNRLSQTSRQKAPKSLTLWGLVKQPGSIELMNPSLLYRSPSTFTPPGFPSHPYGSDIFIPLIHAEYDLNSNEPVQTFEPSGTQDDHEQSLLYDTVIVEVTGNWGANSTCLYHLGIHGSAATD